MRTAQLPVRSVAVFSARRGSGGPVRGDFLSPKVEFDHTPQLVIIVQLFEGLTRQPALHLETFPEEGFGSTEVASVQVHAAEPAKRRRQPGMLGSQVSPYDSDAISVKPLCFVQVVSRSFCRMGGGSVGPFG